jgi:purine nucleosidase
VETNASLFIDLFAGMGPQGSFAPQPTPLLITIFFMKALLMVSPSPSRRRIIIDTDPGQDDAVALLLAFAAPELDIAAITTVAGNVPLALTQRNARLICDLAKRHNIPVFAGCEQPLLRPLHTAEAVHGLCGLDGWQWGEPEHPLANGHAVEAIIAIAKESGPGGLTLCTLGPLTNIALALRQAPEIVTNIAQIIMMGGAMQEMGNTTPVAEFNFYVDPHAADIVFQSAISLVLLPLDATHQVLTTPERLAAIAALDTPVAPACAGMLAFYNRFDEARYGLPGGPLHDPCVIAYLLAPQLFHGRHAALTMETQSPLCLGQSVVDWWQITDRPKNALVVNKVHSEAFYQLLLSYLARL